MTGSVYPHKDFIALSDKFVGVAAHSGSEHGDEEVTVDGEKKRLCNDFGSIPCEVHEKMRQDLAKHNIGQDIKSVPSHIILAPDGKELYRYAGAMGVKQIKDQIEAAAKTIGKGLSRADYVKMTDGLKKAEKDFADGQTRSAIEALKWVETTKAQTPSVERAKKLLDEIDAKGTEALQTAKTLVDAGNVEEASKTLNTLAKDYAGRPIEKEAKKALQGLKKG